MSPRSIRALQVASLMMIWVFVGTVAVWILHLIHVAWQLRDALDASVGISLVAIPVFTTIAVILTYVFLGLRAGAPPEADPGEES